MVAVEFADERDRVLIARLLIQRAFGMPDGAVEGFLVLVSARQLQMRVKVLRLCPKRPPEHVPGFHPAAPRHQGVAQLLIGAQILGLGFEDMAGMRDRLVIALLAQETFKLVLISAQTDFCHEGPACSARVGNLLAV